MTEQEKELQKYITNLFVEQGQREKKEKLERYRHMNRFTKSSQIVFAGSSLMEQFPISEMQLGLDLPLCIYNRGVGGFTTAEMLEVLDICIYDLNPKYLFLNIGTNDLNGPELDLPALMERYGQILQGVCDHLPDAKIFLLAYYPVNAKVGLRDPFMSELLKYRTNTRINEANLAVRKLAEQYGCIYLDVSDGLKDESGSLKAEYTVEGMHFYADGYATVLERLLPILRDLR